MIHDILLSCLNLNSKRLQIQEFIESDAVSIFLHPCEKKILQDIIGIINVLREIKQFTAVYGSNHNIHVNKPTVDTSGETLQTGLYVQAFANGIDRLLEEYYAEIKELERSYLQNPTQSLLFIYHKVQVYEPLALFLRKLIRGICTQKLHGGAIMNYLHMHRQHGDVRIYKAIKDIQMAVNVVFLKQLTHWLLYAKIVDTYGEFFIQSAEVRSDITLESERGTHSTTSGRHTATTWSDAESAYGDIWHFEIFHHFLPRYLSSSWAEKVLFIGQTVLLFKVDASKTNKSAQIWTKSVRNTIACQSSLWNENEHIFYGKIQALQNHDELSVPLYERLIDEIKNYVTMRLSEIAVNQADLVRQLKVFKDFYLLGRGELFLEFIRRIHKLDANKEDKDGQFAIKDFVSTFEWAAHSVGVSDDLDQFSLSVTKPPDIAVLTDYEYFQHMKLDYKINWPLHLLFSPKVIDRYNVLFRFLVQIKKMQFELHMVWCKQTVASKLRPPRRVPVKVMQLRNLLTFFMDNLQYYIQVDVLESQFSILLNTVINKADFEQIQRAHSVFQANILSLCFLLGDEGVTGMALSQSTASSNPVLVVLNDIFHLCIDFCTVLQKELADGELLKEINTLAERFGCLMEKLIRLLVELKATPSTTPLSQLLLRLDFNHYFTARRTGDCCDVE